jgi:heat shock protein HslJ
MKNHYWKSLISLLVVFLFVAACSEQEPAVEEVGEQETVGEFQEAVSDTAESQAVEPIKAADTAEPVQQADEAAGAAYPGEEAPEISQPIYRWGEVADRIWVLVGYGDALNPIVVQEGLVITAAFNSADGQVSGQGSCNNYFAGYESTDEGGLTINGPIGSTMMACPEGMEAEQAYFAALETVTGWALNENGNLELTYSSGQSYDEKLVFAPGQTSLTGTIWQLVNYGDPEEPTVLEEGTSITAVFLPDTDTTGMVSGNATCNNYNGAYTLDGSTISFGPIAGTMMMCPNGMDQETAYLAALQSAQSYEITGPNMQIVYDGGVLNYTSLNLPLENVLWQAVVINGEMVAEDVEITALFTPGDAPDSGSISGNAGCNSYTGSYETSSDISVDPPLHTIGISPNIAMTLMACPDETLASLEESYLSMLGTAESYEILGDQMILHTAGGDIQFAADRQPLLGTLWSLVS